MTNKLSQAYGALDKAILKAVGKGARAYNWTTGDTKAGLANKMLSVAPILETAGVATYSPLLALFTAIPSILLSHIFQKDYIKIEDKEIKALEAGCLDADVERYKEFPGGLAFLGVVTPIEVALGLNTHSIELPFLHGSAQFLRSISNYVMCTDYQPPRKGFVERGIDKITEAVKSYRSQPQLTPELVKSKHVLENLI